MNTQTDIKTFITNVTITPRTYTDGTTKLYSAFKMSIAGMDLTVDFDMVTGSINSVVYTRDYSYSPVLSDMAFPINGKFMFGDVLVVKLIDIVKADYTAKSYSDIKANIKRLESHKDGMFAAYDAMPWGNYDNLNHQITAMKNQAETVKFLEGVA